MELRTPMIITPNPVDNRKPVYTTDGGPITESYEFKCTRCMKSSQIPYLLLLDDATRYRKLFSKEEINYFESKLGIGMMGNAPCGGGAAIHIHTCESCNTLYMIYGGVKEIYNSIVEFRIHGLAEYKK